MLEYNPSMSYKIVKSACEISIHQRNGEVEVYIRDIEWPELWVDRRGIGAVMNNWVRAAVEYEYRRICQDQPPINIVKINGVDLTEYIRRAEETGTIRYYAKKMFQCLIHGRW